MTIYGQVPPDLVSKMTHLVKLASLSQLKSFTQIEDLQIDEPANSHFPVRGHWMAVILLKGSEIKMIFKAHFMTKNVISLSSKIRKLESGPKARSVPSLPDAEPRLWKIESALRWETATTAWWCLWRELQQGTACRAAIARSFLPDAVRHFAR